MNVKRALIIIDDEKTGIFYLTLGNGGQPNAFANTLSGALEGNRVSLNGRTLLMAICGSIGKKRIRYMRFYLESEVDAAFERRHDYRYTFVFRPLKATDISVVEISDAGNERIYYQGGTPDAFVTMQMKKLRRPRGRTPAHYTSRMEYEESYNSRGRPDTAPHRSTLTDEVMRERAKTQSPHVNLEGVKVFTKEEYFDRQKSVRKLKRAAKRNAVKKALDTDD